MAAASSITFYFDFISPYAWLALRPVRHIAKKHNVELRAVPVLFAGLLNKHGQLGPAEIPPKRLYLIKDVIRKAHQIDPELPVTLPPSHPFRPLLPLRVASYPQYVIRAAMPDPLRNRASFPLL